VNASPGIVVAAKVVHSWMGAALAEKDHLAQWTLDLGHPVGLGEQRPVLRALDSGIAFISKPFTLAGLAAKVRAVLDS
jgi:hypothetical protein